MKRHKFDLLSLTLSIPFLVLGAIYVGGDADLAFARADWLVPLGVIAVGIGIVASAARARGERDEQNPS